MRRFLSLLISLIALSALAQSPQISLPTQGYFRPGKYMPVRIEGAKAEVILSAHGAMPTRIARPPSPQEAIAPLLVMSANATEVTAQTNGLTLKAGPLRALAPDERLVGVVEGNEAFAAQLFPGKKVITVPISGKWPSPTSPIASNTFDAIMFGDPPAGLTPWLDAILANGTLIAVKGAEPKTADWVWEKRGEYWVLAHPLIGPQGAEIDLDNYAPSYGIEPEVPLPLRQLVVIGGAIYALLVIASALLLRRRASFVVIAFLSIATIGITTGPWLRPEAAEIYNTSIQTIPVPTQQVDVWQYVRSWREEAPYDEPAQSLVYPMLASESQIQSLQMELRCGFDGASESIHVTLPPHNTIAWLNRRTASGQTRPQLAPVRNTPFTPVLNDQYLSPKVKEVGRESGSDWIVLEVK